VFCFFGVFGGEVAFQGDGKDSAGLFTRTVTANRGEGQREIGEEESVIETGDRRRFGETMADNVGSFTPQLVYAYHTVVTKFSAGFIFLVQYIILC